MTAEERFAQARPRLLRLAYSELGDVGEAEDAVQEAWLRLERVDAEEIENLDGWLTTVVARLALDRLTSARARRETYVGSWLPEPLMSEDPADRVTLDESVSYALLTVLEQLSPAERTAFVLHDVFEVPFGEVAEVVGRTPEAVRQLASRARRHIKRESPRFAASRDEHDRAVRADAMRYAYFGRTSTDDAQDPSLSIPRQLTSCESIVQPLGGRVVAHYWDIESGRKNLAERGNGTDGSAFNISVPRDGGITELLQDAAKGRFDAVIVESIDRLSRMTADSTRVEQELEHTGVGLFAADEPMTANATSILTRRVKQGVAEWYVRDLIEKSRRGMEESVRQGWHTGGQAPYGFTLQPHPHPNPNKAREGMKKHRLILEPIRAAVVLMIFEDYCVRHLGMGTICDKLNRDLERYPPPARNQKDENGLPATWSKSQIQGMLRNPKYTGYNVWNRHDKRKGRPLIRPSAEWIWSPTPSHEAIVTKELFGMVTERAKRNEIGPRQRAPHAYPQRTENRKGRLYPLRGRVRCSLCGRRMEGSHQRGNNWYRCRFVYNRGAIAADAAGHPRALGIKEETILAELQDFMSRRLFGPDRLRFLRDELARSVTSDWQGSRRGADKARDGARAARCSS